MLGSLARKETQGFGVTVVREVYEESCVLSS